MKDNIRALKSEDQYQKNKVLEEEIQSINTTYKSAVTAYEKILDLPTNIKTDDFDKEFAQVLKLLSERHYASAEANLKNLSQKISKEQEKSAIDFKIPENVTTANEPPASGYRQQKVQTADGSFLISIVSADLNSTKVLVDTAADSDCRDNCPVLPLAQYATRTGAFAAINGSFFCPATYPSCAGKTNSFDTLLMNKNKTYFNSDNNVYSVVPAVIFGSGWIRFVSRSLEWGRDTGVDAVIANYPLLVSNGQSTFAGSDDSKLTGRGPRTFVGNINNTVYIGVVYNASSKEAAEVLRTLGLQNALGMDQGGSTALWHGGSYKVGPGRNIPNAIVFVKK